MPPFVSNKLQKRTLTNPVGSWFAERNRKRGERKLKKLLSDLERTSKFTESFLSLGQKLPDFVAHGGLRDHNIRREFLVYRYDLRIALDKFLNYYFKFYQLDPSTIIKMRSLPSITTDVIYHPGKTLIYFGLPHVTILNDEGNLAFVIQNYRELDTLDRYRATTPLDHWHFAFENTPQVRNVFDHEVIISYPQIEVPSENRHSAAEIDQKLNSKYEESSNDDEECPICQKMGTTHKSTCCKQCIHRDCVGKWWNQLPSHVPLSCPMCRNSD